MVWRGSQQARLFLKNHTQKQKSREIDNLEYDNTKLLKLLKNNLAS